MVLEFQDEFRNVYSPTTMVNMFAIGPMHSFIGFAIKNGHLIELMKLDELEAALDELTAEKTP